MRQRIVDNLNTKVSTIERERERKEYSIVFILIALKESTEGGH